MDEGVTADNQSNGAQVMLTHTCLLSMQLLLLSSNCAFTMHLLIISSHAACCERTAASSVTAQHACSSCNLTIKFQLLCERVCLNHVVYMALSSSSIASAHCCCLSSNITSTIRLASPCLSQLHAICCSEIAKCCICLQIIGNTITGNGITGGVGGIGVDHSDGKLFMKCMLVCSLFLVLLMQLWKASLRQSRRCFGLPT